MTNELRTTHHASRLDWSLMIEAILADLKAGVPVGLISAKFHNALAELIVAVARQLAVDLWRLFTGQTTAGKLGWIYLPEAP